MNQGMYRGKSIKTGEWFYGWVIKQNNNVFIYPCLSFPDKAIERHLVEVNPASVGQSTGLKDKDGTEIYGKDIVCLPVFGNSFIEFFEGMFITLHVEHYDKPWHVLRSWEREQIEVIGNITDNPELLAQDKTERNEP